MQEFRIRTEDLRDEEILGIFVPSNKDLTVVEQLKSPTPVVIEGSRGTGKSLLLRVAEAQLARELAAARVLPVYVSFAKSSLIYSNDPDQFQHWMLSRLSSRIIRVLYKNGLFAKADSSLSILAGGPPGPSPEQTRMEQIASAYEDSYKAPGAQVDAREVPDVETFKDAIEDLTKALELRRIAIFFDEAAHIFRPEQQRKFFTLFRDLRSPYISCNAAVYPGVTMYGPSFQPAHDATIVELNRNILEPDYRESMREIVAKQSDSAFVELMTRNGENFDALAYAVSGNPRLLLKTVALAPKLNSSQVTEVLKTFYRTDVWAEHSELAERYAGHRVLVDWGRRFIEGTVIPDTAAKNLQWMDQGKAESTCFIWIHRDAPVSVQEAIRLLAYTGVVAKEDSGIVATRSEIGTRYSINLGCLVAPEATPIKMLTHFARTLKVKRFTEYGANHSEFRTLLESIGKFEEPDMSRILQQQLEKPISVLEMTGFQKESLVRLGFDTVGKALRSKEEDFQAAEYIGPKRSRRMMNTVTASVLEYLSG